MAISKGTDTSIDATAGIATIDTARISDTQQLAVWEEGAGDLKAMVLDITTGTKTLATNTQQDIATWGIDIDYLRVARMSSTKFMVVGADILGGAEAQVLTVSGTTVTGGTVKTLTDSPELDFFTLEVSASEVLWLYQYGTGSTVDSAARILSVSGTTITENARLQVDSDPSTGDVYSGVIFSTTKAAYIFQDGGDNNYLKAQLLDISGTTVTKDGAVQDLNVADAGANTGVATAVLSATEAVAAYDIAASAIACHVITLSGSSLSAGTKLSIPSGQHGFPSVGAFTNNTTVLLSGFTGGNTRTTQVIKSGKTLSYTTSDFVDSVSSAMQKESIAKVADDFALSVFLSSVEGAVIGTDAFAGFTGYDLVIGGGQP